MHHLLRPGTHDLNDQIQSWFHRAADWRDGCHREQPISFPLSRGTQWDSADAKSGQSPVEMRASCLPARLYDSNVPPTTEDRQRARLSRALAQFWAGGAGPTHGHIDEVFALFSLGPGPGSKRDRVSQAVKMAAPQEIAGLVGELIDLLRTDFAFDRCNEFAASQSDIDRLGEALQPYRLKLSDNGRLESSSGLVTDAATLPDEPALREHIGRMQRALGEGDTAQLIGSSKELLETTAKLVLLRIGEPEPSKFPALVGRSLEVLKLHPKSDPALREDLTEPVKKILGGVLQVALGVNELRNDRGTGHGRASAAVALGDRHARLAAGSAVVVATLMLDTLEDPDAPWCRNGPD